jgi:hypothetical protein
MILDRRRMITLIRYYLPEYERSGLVTGPDVSMLSSMPDRRQARQWARLHAGLAGLRAMAEYQLQATELGLLHRRGDLGLVVGDSFASLRDGLVSDMRSAAGAVRVRVHAASRPPWAPYGPSCFIPVQAAGPARPADRPATETEPETGPARPEG